MEAATRHAPSRLGRAGARPGRVFKLASDERLVRLVRSGSEPAFAAIYERHHRAILSYSRHLLGSRHEAEDAVQQTFASAYRDMLRSDRELALRPWLYRIARNHCISLLRRRHEEVALDDVEPVLAGFSPEVAQREDLRALLADLSELPADQREALVLSELHDNSHAEVAEILGCDREKVKSLVFQARSSLIKSREARDTSCEEIRRQISVLSGGGLRRTVLQRHLRHCDGCREFDQAVRGQRKALALVLPVIPSPALKTAAAHAMAAGAGQAAGSAGGAGVAASGAGLSAGTAGGSLAGAAAKLGLPVALVKGVATTATVALVAAGGTAALTSTDPPARGIGKPVVPIPLVPGERLSHGESESSAGAGRQESSTRAERQGRAERLRRETQAKRAHGLPALGAGRARKQSRLHPARPMAHRPAHKGGKPAAGKPHPKDSPRLHAPVRTRPAKPRTTSPDAAATVPPPESFLDDGVVVAPTE
jgi:RNA polymerase sigma factor (sigma-70 family)